MSSTAPISWSASDANPPVAFTEKNLRQVPDRSSLSGANTWEGGSEAGGEDEASSINDAIIVLDVRQNRLGAAIYHSGERKVTILQDVCGISPPFDPVERLCFTVQPSLVVVSIRAAESFVEDARVKLTEDPSTPAADEGTSADDGRVQRPSLPNHDMRCLQTIRMVDIRPGADFGKDRLSNRVLGLRAVEALVRGDTSPEDRLQLELGPPDQSDEQVQRQEMMLALRGLIEATDTSAGFGCLQALVLYLLRRRSWEDEADDTVYLDVFVRVIELAVLDQCMGISTETMEVLGVFPSARQQMMRGKRDKHRTPDSLFDMVNIGKTQHGKRRLRDWFRAPCVDLETIRQRHDAIACLLAAGNQASTKTIRNILGKCSDMRRTCHAVLAGEFQSSRKLATDWAAIVDFAYHICKLREILTELDDVHSAKVLADMLHIFDPLRLREVGVMVQETIDFDSCKDESRVVLQRGVDDQLDEHIRVYDQLDAILSRIREEIIAEECNGMSDEAKEAISCTYMPHHGFLTAVPNDISADERVETEQIARPLVAHESWTLLFSTAETVFFKSPRMQELDDYFGDVHNNLLDREIELLVQLQTRVLGFRELLVECSDAIAELDCLAALADAAKRYDWVRPEVAEENVLMIERGRHPVHELHVEQFIDNPTALAGGRVTDDGDPPSLVALTGANASGKSVYLRQVALIVLMAHVGCFVPAAKATIGLTDRILVRLPTGPESVRSGRSSFLRDLHQVEAILRLATDRSLVLIDEFGVGTLSSNGAALLGAVIQRLTIEDGPKPKTIVATHFHELFRGTSPILAPNAQMQLMHMRVLVDTAKATGDITFLYELADGPSGESFGINCAVLAGMPEEVVAHARRIYDGLLEGRASLRELLTSTEPMSSGRAPYNDNELLERFMAWDLSGETPETCRGTLRELLS